MKILFDVVVGLQTINNETYDTKIPFEHTINNHTWNTKKRERWQIKTVAKRRYPFNERLIFLLYCCLYLYRCPTRKINVALYFSVWNKLFSRYSVCSNVGFLKTPTYTENTLSFLYNSRKRIFAVLCCIRLILSINIHNTRKILLCSGRSGHHIRCSTSDISYSRVSDIRTSNIRGIIYPNSQEKKNLQTRYNYYCWSSNAWPIITSFSINRFILIC